MTSNDYVTGFSKLSSSPTPKKQPRVDTVHGFSNVKGCDNGSGQLGQVGSEPLDVQVKTEPVDPLDDFYFSSNGLSREDNSLLDSIIPKAHLKPIHSTSSPFDYKASPSARHPNESPRRPSDPSATNVSSCGKKEPSNEQPDSSTATCEQLLREGGRRRSVPSLTDSSGQPLATTAAPHGDAMMCQVCGDLAAGFYCGAYICEACKKFFIRASKLECPRYVCLRKKSCVITKESRVHCQYCRYQKCLSLNMFYPKDGQKNANKVGVQEIPCRVCAAPSSGFHFGALTCEGCKGFFRRMVKEREAYSYKCSKNGMCEINSMTRNMCKACRYNKCLQIGMSVEGSRIGRQPNAVKHAISLEAKKQTALKMEPGTGTNIVGNQDSPSSFNFDSVVLDPCLPEDVENINNLPSVDLSQDSSLEVYADSLSKTGEPVHKQEYSTPEPQIKQESLQANKLPATTQATIQTTTHTTTQATQRATPENFRFCQQMASMPSDHQGHVQDLINFSPQASSFLKPRNPGLQMSRSHPDIYMPPSYSQPQDIISPDHSMPGPNSNSSSYPAAPSSLPPSSPRHLSSPSPHSPSPPFVSPVTTSAHAHQGQPHAPFFRSSSVDHDDRPRPLYSHEDKYSDSVQAYASDLSNHYNSHIIETHDTRHMPHEDRMSCHNPQPLNTRHMYSLTPRYSRQANSFAQQRQALPYARPASAQPYFSYHQASPISNESEFIHSRNHQEYSPREDGPDRRDFQRDRPEPLNIPQGPLKTNEQFDHQMKYERQYNEWQSQAPLPQGRRDPSPLPRSTTPHSQRPSPAVTPTPVPHRDMSCSPAPVTNQQSPESPNPKQSTEKTESGALKKNITKLSNTNLNTMLCDAATNLRHLCLVERAKSDDINLPDFATVDTTWERMMVHFNFHAKCIVRFAKKVPGFQSLKLDDQVLLLRAATYSLVILNHSRTYEPDTGFYNYFNFSQKEKEKTVDWFPEFNVLHTHFKHTGVMAKKLDLTDMEYAYLSCILLFENNNPGLEEGNIVRALKERFLDAFQEYEIDHFSSGRLRFGEMLQRVKEFSQFSMQHNIAVGLVITKNSQLHIPQLYAEMYNS